MKNYKWLITGGCGFIGTNLIKKVVELNKNASLRILDNLSVGKKADLEEVCLFRDISTSEINQPPEGVELIIGDVCDREVTLLAAKGVDVIVHLAGNTGVFQSVKYPVLDCKNNVFGTLNMLESARINSVGKFVFASSGAPLGEQEPPIHEDKVPHPVSPYGASKLAGEAYCSAYYRTFGINTIALRFGNVYGPRSKHKNSVVARFIKRALAGKPLEVYGDGGQTRDFIYVDDLVQAIMLAVNKNFGGEIFQIATYQEITVNKLIKQLIRILKEELTQLNITVNYGKPRLGDVRRNYSDISKARKMLGFEPRYDLERGLRETVRWFLTQENILG